MCKECFHCFYGGSLHTDTNKVPCELFNQEVLNEEAKNCIEFIPSVYLDNKEDVETIVEYIVHHKCPFCGKEDEIYDADAEGTEIIECDNCSKKYDISGCLYGLEKVNKKE